MNHKNNYEDSRHMETMTEEQLECVFAIYKENHKTQTFEECVQIYRDISHERNDFGNFEKLSCNRVKLIKKGEKHVKTIP